jgi:hypothetical protein
MVLMGIKSREDIYGASIRAAAEQAAEARKTADRLACEAWKYTKAHDATDHHRHQKTPGFTNKRWSFVRMSSSLLVRMEKEVLRK